MADSIEIAKGHVTIDTRFDGRRISRISHRTGQVAGRRFYEGFRQGSLRRFNRLWGVFLRPLTNLKRWLTRLRMPAIFAGITGSIFAAVPAVSQLASAVGAGAVPAWLSWISTLGIAHLMLGKFASSIENQVKKRIDAVTESIREMALRAAKPGLDDLLKESLKHAPILEKYVKDIAGHVGDVGHALADVLRREANIRRIRTTLDGTARATGMWYSLLDEAAEVILVIASAGTPLFERFTRSMLRVGHTIHDWVLLQETTGALQRHLEESYETLEKFGRGGRDFLIGLFNIINGGVFGAEKIADAFERWGAAFREWSTHSENIEKVRRVIAWFVEHIGDFFRFAAAATAVQVALLAITKIKGMALFVRTLLGLGAVSVPLLLLGGALSALAGGFVYAFTKSEVFRDKLSDLYNLLKEKLGPIFSDWWKWIQNDLLPVIEELAIEGVELLTTKVKELLAVIEDNEEALKEWRPIIVELTKVMGFFTGTIISGMIDEIKGLVTALGWIGRGFKFLREAQTAIIAWAKKTFPTILQFFKDLPGNILDFLKDLPKNLVKVFIMALEGVVLAVSFGLGHLVQFFAELPGKLARWMARTGVDILTTATKWVKNLIDFFSKLPGRVITAIINLPGQMKKKWDETWEGAKKSGDTWTKRIIDFVTKVPGRIWAGLIKLKDRLVNRFAEGWSKATGTQKEKVVAIINHILGIPARAFNALRRLASQLTSRARSAWQAFRDESGRKISSFITWVSQIPGRVVSGLGKIGSRLVESGRQLMQGLLVGVQNRIKEIGGLGGWFKKNLVDPVVNAVKRFFDIRSPSKVFQGIGMQLVAGLWKGMASRSPSKMIGKIFGSMPDALVAMVKKGMINIANLPQKALAKLGGLFDDLFGGGGGSKSGLVGFAAMAWDVFAKAFGLTMGGWRARGSVPGSDHPKGKAIDIMTTNPILHRLIIEMFKRLPGAKYWISMRKIAMASEGWRARPYYGPSPHTDHVHTSFYRQGGRLPEDVLGFGKNRMYQFHRGEDVIRRNQTTIGHQGAVNHYHFGPSSVVLDASSVKDLNDVVKLIQGLQSTTRMYGVTGRRAVA